MEITSFIIGLPGWLLFIFLFVAGVLAAEAGAFMSRAIIKMEIRESSASVNTAVGSIGGLLSLILSFTFSLTAQRYSERRELLSAHSNAIATAYLQTSLISEEQKLPLQNLLNQYVVLLLKMPDQKVESKEKIAIEDLQVKLWEQTTALGKEEVPLETRSHFITAVDEMMKIYRKRKTVALHTQLPEVIWTSVFLLYALSMFSMGYQTSSYNLRRTFHMALTAAAFALVIVLISNMDTARGFSKFKVNQQPLIEVQQMMQTVR